MPSVPEQLFHSLFWEWIDRQSQYETVSSEVTLGDAGRIDLVAKTIDNRYIGFEIKAYINFNDPEKLVSLYKQLRGYRDSKFLDEVYFVSPNTATFCESTGVQAGRFTNELYTRVAESTRVDEFETFREEIEQHLPQEYLDAYNGVNPTSHQKRAWGKHFDRFMNMVRKNTGKTSSEDPLTPETVAKKLRRFWEYHPDEVGVYEIKFDPTSEEEFVSNPTLSVTEKHSGDPLARSQSPHLSTDNEAWIQHYVWKEYGDLREAYLPDKTKKTEIQIDVLQFEGGNHPVDILKSNGDRIGIEAKDANLPGSRWDSIATQIDKYVHSGGLTQIYLAVPESARDTALNKLRTHQLQPTQIHSRFGTDLFDIVGLITVDTSGTAQIVRKAERFDLLHDGYRTDSGSPGYLRTIGYGKQFVRLPQSYASIYEMDPVDVPVVELPPLDEITREKYGEPAAWPKDLEEKLERGNKLTKAEAVWVEVLNRRADHYGRYLEGANWEHVTMKESKELLIQEKRLADQLDVSLTHVKRTLGEMESQGYVEHPNGEVTTEDTTYTTGGSIIPLRFHLRSNESSDT